MRAEAASDSLTRLHTTANSWYTHGLPPVTGCISKRLHMYSYIQTYTCTTSFVRQLHKEKEHLNPPCKISSKDTGNDWNWIFFCLERVTETTLQTSDSGSEINGASSV